ncbi:unnamed protein product [Parajaminaea phylloscopi]
MDTDVSERLVRLVEELSDAQDAEAKVTILHSIEASIHELGAALPFSVSHLLVSSLKVCLKTQNQATFSAALSTVPTIVNNIDSSDSSALLHAVLALAPLVIEKTGDARERVREAASRVVEHIAKAALANSVFEPPLSASRSGAETPLVAVERIMKEAGLMAKSSKIKEQMCRTLVRLRAHSARLPIKPFVPILVDLLTDADSVCREAARSSIVALFEKASAAAKSDLKKELEAKAIRKPVADAILRDVLGNEAYDTGSEPSKSTHVTGKGSETRSSALVERNSRTPPSDDAISPVYIASRTDLERSFTAMLPYFEGKETEHNWAKREASIVKVRGMLRTQVHSQFAEGFASGLRQMSEGILKAAGSLRTTLAIHGISLVTEVADHMGSDLPDVCVDAWLPQFLKMAGFTKRIVANASQAAVSAVLRNVPYRHKYMAWLWSGMQDKTVSTRISMAEHLATLLRTHARYRASALEANDGVSIMKQIIQRGVTDQNKDVRARARDAFFLLESQWPSQAQKMFEDLDAATQKQISLARGQGADSSDSHSEPASSTTASPVRAAFRGSVRSVQSETPSTPRTPSSRGGGPGPSSAIVAAKRAAAARMAEQRKREAEEAARHAEMLDARETDGLDEDGHVQPTAPKPASDNLSKSDVEWQALAPKEHQKGGERHDGYHDGSEDDLPRTGQHESPQESKAFDSSPTLRMADRDLGGPSTAQNSLHRASQHKGRQSGPGSDDVDDTVQWGAEASRMGDVDASLTLDLMAPLGLTRNGFSQSSDAAEDSSAGDVTVSAGQTAGFASENSSGNILPLKEAKRLPATLQSATSASQHHHNLHDSLPSRTPDDDADADEPELSSTLAPALSQQLSMSPERPAGQVSRSAVFARKAHIEGLETPAIRVPNRGGKTTSGNGWFQDRANRLDTSAMSSPIKSRPDASSWIADIRNRRADVSTYKQLAKLSNAFQVSSGGEDERQQETELDTISSQLQKGPRAPQRQAHGRASLQGEVDDVDGVLDEPFGRVAPAVGSGNRQLLRVQTEAWCEDHLFERLFEALDAFFASPDFPCGPVPQSSNGAECSSESTAALILLHKLVENQFPLFPAMGLECKLLRLVFSTIGGCQVQGTVKRRLELGAVTIVQSWSSKTVPASGLASLHAEISRGEDGSKARHDRGIAGDTSTPRVLLCHALAALFHRLPMSVVIEDELPRFRDWILDAFNDQAHVELRQAAIKVLTSACHELSGTSRAGADTGSGVEAESLLGSALGSEALRKDQLDLVMYYLSRS